MARMLRACTQFAPINSFYYYYVINIIIILVADVVLKGDAKMERKLQNQNLFIFPESASTKEN